MYTINFDTTQLASAIMLLATLNDEVSKENEVQHTEKTIAYVRAAMDKAMLDHGRDDEPFEYNMGALVAVVWPLPADERGKYGYTHEVTFYVNPVFFLRNEGVEPNFADHVVHHADNDPRRYRYLHIRRTTTYFVGEQKVHEELKLHGGFTVCFVDNLDGTLTYAVAKCHNQDNYNRKLGRESARNRLAAGGKTVKMSINEFRPWVTDELAAGRWK